LNPWAAVGDGKPPRPVAEEIPMHRRSRVVQRIITALAVVLSLTLVVPASSSAASAGYEPAATWDQSPAPYLGWSSWSMQATTRSGVNPQGNYS
jgi:hypothetical protein